VKLEETIKNLTEIINSKKRLAEVVKGELNDVKRRHKDLRRTVIKNNEDDITVASSDDEKPIVNYVLGYSGKGLVRKVKLMSYSRSKIDAPTPAEIFLFDVNVSSNETIYAFTDKGNIFRIIPDNVPEARGAGQGGVSFDSLFKEAQKGEIPVAFFNIKDKLDGNVIMFTKNGVVKKLAWEELVKFSRSSTSVINLKEGDSVVCVEIDEENKNLFYVTLKGIALHSVKEVSVYGKNAGGIKGISLDDGDSVIYATQVDDDVDTEILCATSFGTFVRRFVGNVRVIGRGGRGVKLVDLGDKKFNECVVFAKCIKQNDNGILTVVDRMGVVSHASIKDVSSNTKAGKGVSIAKLGVIQPLTVYCVRQ
ncbi:MAG: hypothetical protein J6Q38_00815, partial [Clostridia bacterium]|nr:hypothetical protein [Clostridia bacterium]